MMRAHRAYIAKVLSLKGWKVDTAGDGVTCLALVRKQAYDAVVLDYRMPGMNGPKFAAEFAISPAFDRFF